MDYEVVEVGHRKRGVRLYKKIVRPDKYAWKVLWTVGSGESYHEKCTHEMMASV